MVVDTAVHQGLCLQYVVYKFTYLLTFLM